MIHKFVMSLVLVGASVGALAQSVTGQWNFRIYRFGEEADRATVVLKADGERVSGTLNELKLEGVVRGNVLSLQALRPDGKALMELEGHITGDEIAGRMKCSPREETMCDWKATRIDSAPHTPETHVFVPKQYYRLFSGAIDPVLHIRSGDTVIQKTSPSGTTNYLYSSRDLLGELDQNGKVLTHYTQGPNIDEPLAQNRFGSDKLLRAGWGRLGYQSNECSRRDCPDLQL